jgi:bacillopeptidase F (M6 metalloprotease family)
MALNGIRKISVELEATALSAGANTVATFPAQTAILAAGVEVTEALAGATALTFDIGTGDDDDEFVAAYAMAGKSAGAVAPSLPGIAYVGAEDTLDLTIDTLTGTATAGKLRVWALVMDVDGKGADEVARDQV